MRIETEIAIYRVMAIVGIVGMGATLVLEYLGVFRDWGIILTVVFGVVSVVSLINSASRGGVREILINLLGLRRDLKGGMAGLVDEQRKTNATLERIEQALRRDREPS